MRTVWVFLLFVLLNSCISEEEKLSGFWLENFYSGFNENINLTAFQIENDSIRLYYEVNVNEIQPYKIIDSFLLIGTNGDLKIPFKFLPKDTLLIDNSFFVRNDTQSFVNKAQIGLINFSTGIFQSFEDSIFRQSDIGLRRTDSLELLLGDKVTSLNDLPFLLICYHCKPLNRSNIFIDKTASLKDLKMIYFHLYYLRQKRVALITKIENGKFEGVLDRIVVFENEMDSSQLKMKLPPLPSLSPSYFVNKELLKQFDYTEIKSKINSIEDLRAFKLRHCKRKDCLIEINSDLASMEEFLRLKTIQHKLRLAELEESSQMKFKKSYDELEIPDKRVVVKDLDNILIILI